MSQNDSAGSTPSLRKTAVKLFVRTNPEPKPVVALSPGDGAIVSGDPHRPRTAVPAQALQLQTRVRLVLQELLKGVLGCGTYLRREAVIQLPEIGSAQ